MLVFETLKNKKSDFLNSNTCSYSRLYGSPFLVQGRLCRSYFDWLSAAKTPVMVVLPVLNYWWRPCGCLDQCKGL